jgi:small subunit ribosomal protein S6
MRDYEFTYILRPELEDEDRSATIQQVEGWITEVGGTVTNTNHWGLRRLAYPIDNTTEGYYVLVEMQSPPASVRELERRLLIAEPILRYLIVRKEE